MFLLISLLVYLLPNFLHSLFPLYSFLRLNTGGSSLPCTGFFHVLDNPLLNEIVLRVTGTKFSPKVDINILMLDL